MKHFPCACCGHLVFDGPPGSKAVCPVCEWEDDALGLEFATSHPVGADALTLFEAQRAGRPDAPEYAADPTWRPIDMAVDHFEDIHDPEARRAPAGYPTVLYYWRETFWLRSVSI